MGDLTKEQAIEKLRNLPEDKQKQVLLGLAPEMRKGILDQLQTPQTAGQKYMQARRSGALPTYDVSSFVKNPQERFGEIAGEAGRLATEYQREATPEKFTQGKPAGTRPFLEQMGRGAQSMFYEGEGVAAQLAGGLMDPKTLAVFVVSKLSPAGMLAAASYFGLQSSQQVADAIRSGQISPENAQKFLLGLAGMSGSAAMAGEQTPATIKERIGRFKAGAQRVGRQVTGPESGLRQEVRRQAEGYQKAVPENKAKLEETIRDNTEKIQASRFREGEERFALQKKNKEIEAENVRKTQEAETRKTQRQESLVKVEETSKAARTKIEQVENGIWQEANRKFDAVKAKIGVDQPGEPVAESQVLLDKIKAEEAGLAPEQAGLLRRMTKMVEPQEEIAGATSTIRREVMTSQGMKGSYEALPANNKAVVDGIVNMDIARRYGADIGKGDPVTWGKLQSMKTATETAMRSPSIAPVMKRALGAVDDTIIDMMGQMAESKGATAEWQEAREFYTNWRKDFHTPSGPKGSGSPVAGTLQAVDPYAIKNELLRTQGETGNRAVDILRKYPQYGGNEAADLVTQIYETQKTIGKAPGPVKLTEPKPIPEGSTARPALKTLPEKVPQPEVNTVERARKDLEDRSRNWGSYNARDIGIIGGSVILGSIVHYLGGMLGGAGGEIAQGASSLPFMGALGYEGGKYFGSRALRNPAVVSWLEKAPPEEIRALSNIPGADKVKIINGITESAVETLQQMDFSTDNTAFARAKAELPPGSSLSDISKRASKLNADEIAARQQRFNKAVGRGKPVNLTPEVRAFLGPRNVSRILAAAAARRKEPTNPVVTNRKEALHALGR